jgi:hypothetical protein
MRQLTFFATQSSARGTAEAVPGGEAKKGAVPAASRRNIYEF